MSLVRARYVSPDPINPGIIAKIPFATAFEHIALGVAHTHATGRIGYANPFLCRLLDSTGPELYGLDIAQFRAGDSAGLRMEIRRAILAGDTWQGEVELSAPEGRGRAMLESVYPVHDDAHRVESVFHFFHDVSALRYAERLSNFAFRDRVTGLPNRNLFVDRVQAAIQQARRKRGGFAVLYADIENFKRVNDALGRDAGDELLRLIVVRMERALRESDTLARVGADELAVIIGDVANADAAAVTAEKLVRACTGWYQCGAAQHGVTFTAGMALYPRDGGTADALLQSAEGAMYCAKAEQRSSYPAAASRVGSRYPIGG